MLSINVERAKAPQLAAAMELRWGLVSNKVAIDAAWFMTMMQELGPTELIALIGPDAMQESQALVLRMRRLYAASRMLDNGTAFLLLWSTQEEGQHVAVVRRQGLPQGAELGVWPIAIIAAGVVLSGIAAHVVVRYWETDVTELAQDNKTLELKMLERIQANAEALTKTDPARAARMMEANTKALAAQRTALADPKSWLERAFQSVGRIAGSAVSPLLVVGGLLLLSRFMEKRAA